MKTYHLKALTLSVLLMTQGAALHAQQVVLDLQTRAGELNLFQSVSDPDEYYYAATEARVATQSSGLPSFSFTRYIRTNTTAGVDSTDGVGSGVVTAVVELGVTDAQLEVARDALREINPQGTIVGPVTFKSGSFALVSSYADAEAEATETVAGVGKMPLLEGDAAAVSIRLTQAGAEELWANFNRATPDVTFSFVAKIDGYRSPKRALIEANFERIYSHQSFEAGIATPYLQAEIEAAFDELRRTGAIKITQVGEDENMEALIETAYKRLIDVIFENAESTGIPSVTALASAGGGTSEKSLLDKASALLTQRTKQTEVKNAAIRERNASRQSAQASATQARRATQSTQSQLNTAQSSAAEIRQRIESLETQAAKASADAQGFDDAGDAESAEAARQAATAFQEQVVRLKAMAAERDTEAQTSQNLLTDKEQVQTSADAAAEAAGETEPETPNVPIAVVASYRMKKVRESGTYTIDLNKYTADSLELRFDRNIGDLREYLDNDAMFKTEDLDASGFRQREVQVFIDGLNMSDFGSYVNFAGVQLRKPRADGHSFDEVRIDRQNFSAAANSFKLTYAKIEDGHDDSYYHYDYKVDWSFFGGAVVSEDWRKSTGSSLPLIPPYQPRRVFLEGSPDDLADAGVRAIDVSLYYELAGQEQMKRVSLRPSDPTGMSATIDFMLPRNSQSYQYEISWRLRGGERRTIGRTTSTDSTIFIDEIPEA